MATIEQIKQLREETSVSIAECKKALEVTGGDLEKAKEILRKWGRELAEKKSSKATTQGLIEVYIHPNKKIGVMLEIHCESDFVARSPDFQKLAHEICLQIASMNPLFLDPEDIPDEFLDGERKIYEEQLVGSGKPRKIIDQIIEGKLKKYCEEVSLLRQPWIRDETKIIRDLIQDYIARLGENIVVERFVRYEI